MLFLTKLAKEAEITILSARDTTRPGLMGNDVGLYKEGYSTWLLSRSQNQPRSWSAVYVYFYFSVKPSRIGLELEHGSYPDFLCIFSLLGFFVAGFFWPPSNRICFVSGCSALYALGYSFVFIFNILTVCFSLILLSVTSV